MRYKNKKLKFSIYEKLLHVYQKSKFYNNKFNFKKRQEKINNLDFTIISNNCWGGICYEYFGLKKLSPTVGLYIFSNDYIKFIYNLKEYLSKPMIFITYEESKYKNILLKRGHTNVPIGLLGDVEIIFLHYLDEKSALEKWERRTKRVNYNNLIIKYSNQNYSSYEDIEKIIKLELGKKIIFSSQKINGTNKIIYYSELKDAPELLNDTYIWNKYIDIFSIINKKEK